MSVEDDGFNASQFHALESEPNIVLNETVDSISAETKLHMISFNASSVRLRMILRESPANLPSAILQINGLMPEQWILQNYAIQKRKSSMILIPR
ncbi:MAG: hypothetical protein ACLRWF_08335 [Ruthenibacterium sp.]